MNGRRLTDKRVAYYAALPPGLPLSELVGSLACEVQASRKLIAALRALHAPTDHLNGKTYSTNVCRHDGHWFPCPDIRLIEEAGL